MRGWMLILIMAVVGGCGSKKDAKNAPPVQPGLYVKEDAAKEFGYVTDAERPCEKVYFKVADLKYWERPMINLHRGRNSLFFIDATNQTFIGDRLEIENGELVPVGGEGLFRGTIQKDGTIDSADRKSILKLGEAEKAKTLVVDARATALSGGQQIRLNVYAEVATNQNGMNHSWQANYIRVADEKRFRTLSALKSCMSAQLNAMTEVGECFHEVNCYPKYLHQTERTTYTQCEQKKMKAWKTPAGACVNI